MEAKKEIFLQAWCSLAMCQLLMCTIELKKMEFKKIIEQVFENKLDITILFGLLNKSFKGCWSKPVFPIWMKVVIFKDIWRKEFSSQCEEAKFSMKEYHCSQTLKLFLSIFKKIKSYLFQKMTVLVIKS